MSIEISWVGWVSDTGTFTFHMWVPDFRMNCTDLTIMRGYQDDQVWMSGETTGIILKNRTQNSFWTITIILLPHTWYMKITDHMIHPFRLPWKMIHVKMIYKYFMSHHIVRGAARQQAITRANVDPVESTGSTLAQVMACCLAAPSHYMYHRWFIISEVQWHST